jgi:mannose-1-phosphate guanylyltransferase/mannose-6-phosphate isomerase
MVNQPKLIVTILSGGAGSRLWPLSRENYPKPFIRLKDGQSLLQKAFLRGINLPFIEEILTVTNRELIYLTIDHYEELKKPTKQKFILEPEGKNTAAAVATAAIDIVNRYGNESLMLVLPADHIVKNDQAFVEAVDKATSLAKENYLVTFGIKPLCPDINYGYIEAEENRVLRFIEKPSKEKAKTYFKSKNFYWNSGMFCFKASALLNEMKIHCPEILAACQRTLNQSRLEETLGSPRLILNADLFKEVPSNSIDYALMEKSNHVAVVTCSIDWSDIGSWNAFSELNQPGLNNNRVQGEAILFETKNSSVIANKRLVVLIGMENVIVVDTPDAILVTHKFYTQHVKTIYSQLKNGERGLHKAHREVHRPWGSYTILEDELGFKVKKIIVKPQSKLSLQSHKKRAEHWVVVKGEAEIINNDKKIYLKENQSTYIEQGHKHQLINSSNSPLEIIEVQSGVYLGEDDIVRYEDKYGR